ncbi:MAG: hypothetical protein V1732_05220 [Patescibacteria group bacterium]
MNGSKEEKGGYGLCCSSGLKPVYLGLVLFVIGLIMQGGSSVPEIIMIVGSLIVITGLISMFFHKEK